MGKDKEVSERMDAFEEELFGLLSRYGVEVSGNGADFKLPGSDYELHIVPGWVF